MCPFQVLTLNSVDEYTKRFYELRFFPALIFPWKFKIESKLEKMSDISQPKINLYSLRIKSCLFYKENSSWIIFQDLQKSKHLLIVYCLATFNTTGEGFDFISNCLPRQSPDSASYVFMFLRAEKLFFQVHILIFILYEELIKVASSGLSCFFPWIVAVICSVTSLLLQLCYIPPNAFRTIICLA